VKLIVENFNESNFIDLFSLIFIIATRCINIVKILWIIIFVNNNFCQQKAKADQKPLVSSKLISVTFIQLFSFLSYAAVAAYKIHLTRKIQ